MERLSRTLPWDHPAARELDKTVHKRRTQGEFVFFFFSLRRVPKSPFFIFFTDTHWILKQFYWDMYCYIDFCDAETPMYYMWHPLPIFILALLSLLSFHNGRTLIFFSPSVRMVIQFHFDQAHSSSSHLSLHSM